MLTRQLPKEFLEEQKRKLQKKLEELRAETAELQEEDPYLQEGRDDESSEAVEEAMLEDNAKELTDIRTDDVEESIEQVERALEKLEEGTYGICEKTGEPIDMARLEVYPEATTAID